MATYQDLTHLGLENRTYTVAEWLAIERDTGERFEYYDGRLVHWQAMAGGSSDHAMLAMNFGGSLFKVFTAEEDRFRLCNTFSSDLRIKLPDSDKYVYPDVAVVCGDIKYDSLVPTAVSNPSVVVEVMSKSSAKHDSGQKFEYYSALDTLREYALVDQDDISVEVRTRHKPGGAWDINFYHDREGSIALPTLGLQLPTTELYRGLRFEWEDDANYGPSTGEPVPA